MDTEKIVYDAPLTAEEVSRVIEGKGAARRVPNGLHMWFFKKWFRIPEDAKLKTGFGDICFTKDRNFVVYPDGKLEYIGYCTNPSGNISPDYLLNCCLSKNSRWKWFDSVRRDIRFVNALNWLEALINK